MISDLRASILVTGGLGFIGSNLCNRLLTLGAEVTVLDRSIPSDPSGRLATLCSGVRLLVADIRDEQAIKIAVEGQDCIFDLAGASGAVDSDNRPLDDLDVNCRGHLTLLEACRMANPSARLVFPSSRLVYGPPRRLPVDESHPLCPQSIYAVHKLAVENYMLMYARRYGMPVTLLRISNPFGPLQTPQKRSYGIANRIIQAAVKGDKIPIFGDGTQLRDYLYIDDLTEVMLRAASSEIAVKKIYNIGSGIGTSVRELAEGAVDAAGNGDLEHVAWPHQYRAIETGDYISDISLAERDLGWRPTTCISQGIAQTVAYYRSLAM